jgi:hypothetical protein
MARYFINGSEVSEDRLEREINDNFNAGITQTIDEDESGNVTLNYNEEQ